MMSKRDDNDWSSLENEAKSLSANRGPRCGVATLLEDITEVHGAEASDAVLRTLANHRLTPSSIHKALGPRLDGSIELPSAYSLQRHRSSRCGCKGDGS